MLNVKQLKQKIGAHLSTCENIVGKAVSEARSLTPAESEDLAGLRTKIAGLKATLAEAEALLGADGAEARGLDQYGAAGRSEQAEHRGGPFQAFGEQLRSIVEAARPGGQVDPRLFEIRAASGLNEAIGSDGGYLVQADFSTRLLERVNATSQLASRCTQIPISGGANGIKMPRLDESSRANGSRHGGVLGYWLAEAAQISGTKPKIATTELTLKKVCALVYSTDELLADSAALASFVERVAAAELSWQLDNKIISGNGAGVPLGILNAGSSIVVDKEAQQLTDTVVVENVLKMYSRLPASSVNTACWYVSQSVFPQLYSLALVAGLSGVPVFLPANGLSGKPFNTLLGLPVIATEHAAKLGDKGDVMLCDMSHYLLAQKGGIQSASSIHVLFDTDQMVFRFLMRVDGSPAVSAPMTPYNGGPTESPFIILGERA